MRFSAHIGTYGWLSARVLVPFAILMRSIIVMAHQSSRGPGVAHWQRVHKTRDPDSFAWYQGTPAISLDLIESFGAGLDAPVIDVGAGSSHLVDHLLDAGYVDLTVLDISKEALAVAQTRLGVSGNAVEWIAADVTDHPFERTFGVWHDRAAFHFLVDTGSQQRYVEQLHVSLRASGVAIIATFAPDGPEQCSGLPVQRYSEETLSQTLGNQFHPLRFEREAPRHPTEESSTSSTAATKGSRPNPDPRPYRHLCVPVQRCIVPVVGGFDGWSS